MRLLFVADEVPDHLARLVSFLNEATVGTIEVLALELKQFRGASSTILVPRVFGRMSKRSGGGASSASTIRREDLIEALPNPEAQHAVGRILDEASAAGATFEWGSRGVSIRGRCPTWSQPVTIAWLYPGEQGWMRTRHLSFGGGIMDYELPQPLRAALEAYAAGFANVPGAMNASSQGVLAWAFRPEQVADRLDDFIVKIRQMLQTLASLPQA